MPDLLEAGTKWASRKSTPSTITGGCGPGVSGTFWSGRGYRVKTESVTVNPATTTVGAGVISMP